MTRKKLGDACKVHITATIPPNTNKAIENYRNDERNRIDGNKPPKSTIITAALDRYLAVYMPKKQSKQSA